MVEAPGKQMPDGAGLGQISWEPSELLANYERLLSRCRDELQKPELNPYQHFPRGLWKSFPFSFLKHTLHALQQPNAVGQEIAGGAAILQELERLDDQALRGIAECNRINHRRLLQRSVFGSWSKFTVSFGFVLTAFKAIKEIFGTDIFKDIFGTDISTVRPYAVQILVGLVLGSVLIWILSRPALLLVRALDDLIAITLVRRGLPKSE
ncbi:hypothetical protein CQ14_02590 [Bradyrhizobium lablabi]|uniref:Uncharacterized protein n=1 Tax=Bradyrhizobium lablabi TaxID=722472 RepID=A0A0R3N202_9BRAD|nr:hypothetical protein [Bradyrhizobium lablabi]KRR26404.1 hypothetical protein CQ14_02590 [Bradyrhizobium lablabi]